MFARILKSGTFHIDDMEMRMPGFQMAHYKILGVLGSHTVHILFCELSHANKLAAVVDKMFDILKKLRPNKETDYVCKNT